MQDGKNTYQTAEEVVETALSGQMLLEYPLLNKGSAFPEEEREAFNLLGLLPPHVAQMEDQLTRTFENYQRKDSDLERYIYLASLHDRNETLFFRLVSEHIPVSRSSTHFKRPFPGTSEPQRLVISRD